MPVRAQTAIVTYPDHWRHPISLSSSVHLFSSGIFLHPGREQYMYRSINIDSEPKVVKSLVSESQYRWVIYFWAHESVSFSDALISGVKELTFHLTEEAVSSKLSKIVEWVTFLVRKMLEFFSTNNGYLWGFFLWLCWILCIVFPGFTITLISITPLPYEFHCAAAFQVMFCWKGTQIAG